MKKFVIPPPGAKLKPFEVPGYRQAALKDRLNEAGGKRTSFNLTPQAVRDIEAIKLRDGHETATDAVIAAVRYSAKRRQRSKP